MILTFNEAPNIGRTLDRLSWAKTILVIDSFSTDRTLEIVRDFSNAVVIQREFDHFSDQCNFGLQNIDTLWTLSIDADYICPMDLPKEVCNLRDTADGYLATFRYCVYSRPLRATLYPPRIVLYKTSSASYVRDGHAHRVKVKGSIEKLRSVIDHDDHKSIQRWLKSQATYASLEAEKLLGTPPTELGFKDKLRKQIFIAPPLIAIYCLMLKGLLFNGWAGIYYTLQRVYAELLLSIELLDRRLRP